MTVFGMRYLLPELEQRPATLVAVNLGCAIVPASLAVYLIIHDSLGWSALVGVGIVTAAVHRLARPIPGLGVAVPALVPALIAAGVGLLITPAAASAVARATQGWAEPAADRFDPGRSAQATCYPTTG